MRAFISHSHRDKAFARRLARRLEIYGVPVWIDDNQFQAGDVLPGRLKAAISKSDVVLVVASEASATSKWVGLEMDYARRRGLFRRPKPIIPVLIDDVSSHPRFEHIKGVDARQLVLIDREILKLAKELGGSAEPDERTSKRHLSALREECRDLAPLIDVAMGAREMHIPQLHCVADDGISEHDVEFALVTGYEVANQPTRDLVLKDVAALAFAARGLGYQIFLTRLAEQRAGTLRDETLLSGLSARLRPERIDAAIDLFAIGEDRNDMALETFITANFHSCSEAQRNRLVRVLTVPHRSATAFTPDAVFSLSNRMPQDEALHRIWYHWIVDGDFEPTEDIEVELGPTKGLWMLFSYIERGRVEARDAWERLINKLFQRVRGLARSGDARKVLVAIEYIKAAAARESDLVDGLSSVLQDASGSAEWRHLGSVGDELSLLASGVARAAKADRNWRDAAADYNELRATRRQSRN